MTHVAPHKATAVWFPNQRVWRTILQVTASSVLTLVTFIGGLSVFAPQFVAALEPILPNDWYVWLLGAVTFIGLLSGALAKIMLIPGVNDWLSRHTFAGSAPRSQIAELEQRAYSDFNAKNEREKLPLD